MTYTIKNDKLTVEIDALGAELKSIKAADGTEYLWQGDPKYWAGRAYNLFPIVGRLTDGKYTYKGRTYEMNLHGFARKSVFAVTEQAPASVTFELRENGETLKAYPFPFRFTVAYALGGDTLDTKYRVENTGAEEMVFAVGGHPGFNVPLGGDGKFEDWYLQFSTGKDAEEIVMSPACYVTRETRPFKLECVHNLKCGRCLDLKHELFDNDAIILANMAKAVTLKSDKSKRGVTVKYPGMKYLGIWHKPSSDAPYVCIEPWASLPAYDGEVDALETKRDMTRLRPGGTYQNGFSITVK